MTAGSSSLFADIYHANIKFPWTTRTLIKPKFESPDTARYIMALRNGKQNAWGSLCCKFFPATAKALYDTIGRECHFSTMMP